MVSVETVSGLAASRRLFERVSLNHQILDNKYWTAPYDGKGHESYVPVGRGVRTSVHCAEWRSFSACLDVEAHAGKTFRGEDATGKVFVRHNHLWCGSAACPVCFIRGFAAREARNMAARFDEAVKRGLGMPEHVVVSFPESYYHLGEDELRVVARNALVERGFNGGASMFHGYREDRSDHVLRWHPHYHFIVVPEGGTFKCRGCSKTCSSSCDGFEERGRQAYVRDKLLVKVLPKRKTIHGTAFYQLHHSTMRIGLRRSHIVKWFGVCSTRKYKSGRPKASSPCGVCGGETTRAFYVGHKKIEKNIGSKDYRSVFLASYVDGLGNKEFVERVGDRFG